METWGRLDLALRPYFVGPSSWLKRMQIYKSWNSMKPCIPTVPTWVSRLWCWPTVTKNVTMGVEVAGAVDWVKVQETSLYYFRNYLWIYSYFKIKRILTCGLYWSQYIKYSILNASFGNLAGHTQFYYNKQWLLKSPLLEPSSIPNTLRKK